MADEEVMCARISVQMDHYLTCWMHLEGENKKWEIGFGGALRVPRTLSS